MATLSSEVLVQSINTAGYSIATVITLSSTVIPSEGGCVVIYGVEGKIIRSLALADLLTEKEIAEHTKPSLYSDQIRDWRTPETKFILPVNQFRMKVVFEWGKEVTINLATGEVKP